MIVAWTGHRPDLFRQPEAARLAVDGAVRGLLSESPDPVSFLVGGQRGVDIWAMQAGVNYGIPFGVILPFDVSEFTRDWSGADRLSLTSLLGRAEALEIAGGYTQRNRALVSRAQLLIAVWTGTRGGGTSETIDLAREAGTPVREVLLEPSPRASTATGRGI
jgi:hypothetical protein